jgi:nitrite reductase/ring-hydroxylating ferredoxin subunit
MLVLSEEFVRAIKAEEIALGGMKAVEIQGNELVVCNCGGIYYAISRRCGHMNAPLELGTLDGTYLTCPMHCAQFDVSNGEALSGPVSSDLGGDGASLIQARGQLRKEARALERTFREQLNLGSDPVVRAVFAEDAAALVGNLIAFVGIALHQTTGSAIPDGVAAILVGLLLGFVAFQLAKRNGDITIGGQAAALRREIGTMIAAQPGIVAVSELVVTFIAPRQAWVVARVAINETIDGAGVEKLARETENFLRSKSPVIVRVDIVPRGR